ncbi:GNAT family N-acetyltransferase [Acidisphaera sp. L21]|uniref:GNAT family N-acetyltransferase n=1 Tax=Acidisphaera sp. L21 TaxID=1641851 RepID=UPI00131D67C6|nr:GNAT family protein [Acidisphaera sp. L21]
MIVTTPNVDGAPPVGPLVDATPRPLPARIRLRGRDVELEPLHVRHAPELWAAAQGADESWAYMGYGPFADEAAMTRHVASFATTHDPMVWAVRPIATGVVSGWLSLMEIQPGNAAIELGNIWFGPRMQRTRAGTEAMFLLLRLAADELGYRRLVWKCNALNAPSRRAAARLGFEYEGTLRAHLVVKGRRRDTAFFAILADEWPRCRDAMVAWMDPSNFAAGGTAIRGMASFRS